MKLSPRAVIGAEDGEVSSKIAGRKVTLDELVLDNQEVITEVAPSANNPSRGK